MQKLLIPKMIIFKHSIDLYKNRRAEAQFRSVLIFYDFVWRAFAC